MSQPKIITVTLNPAYDLVGGLKEIHLGKVNQVKPYGRYPAGKGINVAKVLSALGQPAAVTGFLGAENSAEFYKEFAKYQLTSHFVEVEGATRTNIKLTDEKGSVTDINFQGFTVSEQQWNEFVANTKDLLVAADYVVVAGSLPQGVTVEAFSTWLNSLSAAGAKVILDTSGAALNAGLRSKVWMIKPNDHELSEYVGRELQFDEDIIKVAQELNETGIDNVVVSLGSRGSIWVGKGIALRARPPRIDKIISTVGAGDSMVAGMVFGAAQGMASKDILRLATAVSAYAVMQENVGVYEEATMQRLGLEASIEPFEPITKTR